jgi:hypothetical protein
MSQEDLLIHIYCLLIYCLLNDQFKMLDLGRLRSHGPEPTLADSEVLAIECFGEVVGTDTGNHADSTYDDRHRSCPSPHPDI